MDLMNCTLLIVECGLADCRLKHKRLIQFLKTNIKILPCGGGDTDVDFGLCCIDGYGEDLLLFKDPLEGNLSHVESCTVAVTAG